jgi:hypothetical protein
MHPPPLEGDRMTTKDKTETASKQNTWTTMAQEHGVMDINDMFITPKIQDHVNDMCMH